MVTINVNEIINKLTVGIEDKAIESHERISTLKPKYQIPDDCWLDWFEEGYNRALDDLNALLSKEEKEQLNK